MIAPHIVCGAIVLYERIVVYIFVYDLGIIT